MVRSFRWRVLTTATGVVPLPIRTVTEPVDFADLGEPSPAIAAPAQMGVHPAGVPGREPPAQMAAEPVAGPAALRVLGHRQVLLQIETA